MHKLTNTEKANNYKRTRKGLPACMISAQKQRSHVRGFPPITYDTTQLREWLFAQPQFEALFTAWEKSGYAKELIPSCDRIDEGLGYSLDNIQLTTWAGNVGRHHKDRVEGLNNKQNRPIVQLTKQGLFVREHHSIRNAARLLNASAANIHKAALRRGSAYGYKWELKDAYDND